jgi:hypothetical protein
MHDAGMEYLLDDTFFDFAGLSTEDGGSIIETLRKPRGNFSKRYVLVNDH